MNGPNNAFGKNLRDYRKRKGLTQIELADLSGVAVNSIRLYEGGKRLPSMEICVKLADSLDCTYFDLCNDEIGRHVLKKITKAASEVPPLPKKGFGSSGLKEYFAVSNFMESLGYKERLIDSDDDTEEIIGYDEDGAPDWQRINKYCEITDERNGEVYIMPVKAFDEIRKRITNYAKFEISEYLKLYGNKK